MSQVQNIKRPISPLLLKQCEAIIEGELENLQKLFRALEVIEQRELYKGKYGNFSSYCHKRWNISGALDLQGELTLNLKTKD
ncbi:MAG: hypothetical protein U9O64_02395 [Campylobacterota bacterium]|nr:hypothetical protein [Campylobacterota bacterium]